MRTACLLVPGLSLIAALRAHPECAQRALAVAETAGPRAELIAVSATATRFGVQRGDTTVHARSLCKDLVVCVASPASEHTAHQGLLDVALSFAPRAALAPRVSGIFAAEAAVYLDASGVEALFRSEAGFAAALGARTKRLGLPAVVTIASSRRVAHIAARLAATPVGGEPAAEAPTHIIPAGAESHFLGPLSLDILEPDDALSEIFTRFGLRSVRDLLALPRRALVNRLGPRVLEWLALAHGTAVESPLPRAACAPLVEAIDLDHPVDRVQPLLFVLQGLLTRLLARLELRHLGCGDLRIELDLTSGARDARRIGVAAPTHDLRVLTRLISHALEARPPEAPVQTLALETEGRPLRTDQLDLFRPAGPSPTALGQTLAELESLCGPGRVGAPVISDDHHPDAFDIARFALPRKSSCREEAEAERDPRVFTAALALRALRPPVVAQVRVRAQRPEWVRSAIASGQVVRSAGPWRITGGWWSHEGRFAFDSFDVQLDDGTVARLRLDHLQRVWQIDAVYD